MKKRVYIPNMGSPSPRPAPSPTVHSENRDLPTRPIVSAASVNMEKSATILFVEPVKASKQQTKPTAEERAQQSTHDRQRLRGEHRQQILQRAMQHKPAPIGTLGPIEFDRCVCGFTLARFESRTWWIRVKSPDGHEPAIRDVSEPEELAYALRTACTGSLDWKSIKQLLGEQNALKQQKSHPAPA
jgi:hypothetical protein